MIEPVLWSPGTVTTKPTATTTDPNALEPALHRSEKPVLHDMRPPQGEAHTPQLGQPSLTTTREKPVHQQRPEQASPEEE